jgi:hypothetical protein
MDHQAFAQLLGNYGEFLGAIGVVVTLGYLAVQIRHNTRSNRISAELENLKQLTSWVRRFSTDKEAQRLWDLVAEDSELLSAEESRQWLWLIGELGWIAQTAFIQQQRGYLSTEAWNEFERVFVGVLQYDFVIDWWEKRETPYSREFVSSVDTALAERDSDWRPQITARVQT